MKIIEALREGDLSFVQVKHNQVTVAIRKVGELVSITTKGRGNVRFAKIQAKLLTQMINGY
ncbi:TPA: hypothetical protein ACHS7Y_001736 [Citrobacter freundii]|nr:hypothetical protein [Citrobacter freundii]